MGTLASQEWQQLCSPFIVMSWYLNETWVVLFLFVYLFSWHPALWDFLNASCQWGLAQIGDLSNFTPIGPKLSPSWASTHGRLKICKSQQLEPQLILCYEDFIDHHLPDIHNKGIIRGEGKVYRLKWKTESKKKKNKTKKGKKNIWIWETLDTCFLYCTFSLFFTFIQKWS